MNKKFSPIEKKDLKRKFQMDEELQFKIAARSNKHLGEWGKFNVGQK